ncbi:hypothetical protein DRP77_10860 [Candidatus Poribacteria bacterium]|nr:MAG: hypothetical protein DRP77_10860 [Candidatus Poribacteria bacterium]
MPARLRFKLNLLPASFRRDFPKLRKAMARAADRLAEELNARVMFIPMDDAPNSRDDEVCRDIVDLMRRRERAAVLRGQIGVGEVIGVYASMDLVISMRFHGLVFAALSGVPIVGIHSRGQEKVRRLMDGLGQEAFCVSAEEIVAGGESLTDPIEKAWSNRISIRGELRSRVHVLRRAALDMNRQVRRWCEERL